MGAQVQSYWRVGLLLGAGLLAATALAACNTIEGAGRDLKAAGDALNRSAERAQGAEEAPPPANQTTPPPAPANPAPPTGPTTTP
jgi:predicted small secreted protein